MENQIKYVQLSADNEENCMIFISLMNAYINEMNEHDVHPLPERFRQKWINSIIAMQGPADRHLELCYVDEILVGFLYGKIDHEDHKGFIKPGYGYIMEFYVKPEYRRKGYGRMMFKRLERMFHDDGADMMYLTADPVTGKPFWEAMGFVNTNEQSPENQQDIYEKAIWNNVYESGILIPMTKVMADEISSWEYESPYDVYSFKGRPNGYLMDDSTWGTEQFCLTDGGRILGQVSCQYSDEDLWVGWSMAPELCGKGNGADFVRKCVEELRRVKRHTGRILLRVASCNQRAIKAYQKAGFVYVETILDEIAYTGHSEDFWVMENRM
ncbi:MAG: GNAT family N-acetyltransferase [Lachnospiraceae bacterium]|nr:GNAT family N-acetyltransferase [Lachnospiraceae bacterium]